MYSSNNIQALLKSKSIKHNIDKSIFENTELKLNNLSKNIDKLKRKVLHMDLDEELSSIKVTIDNIKTSIKTVNDDLKNGIKFKEDINNKLKEIILNVETYNKLTSILTHEDLDKFSTEIREIKNSFDELIEKTDEPGNYFSINLINSISSGQYTKPSNINFT